MDERIPIAGKLENDGTKRRIKINPLLASSLFFVALMAVIVLYNPYSGGCPVVTVGFVNIRPIISGIYYQGSNLTATFNNSLGEAIKLGEITMNETMTGRTCLVSYPPIGTVINGGEIFTISSANCPYMQEGEAWDVVAVINYNQTIGGTTTNHSDKGHIKGWAESL